MSELGEKGVSRRHACIEYKSGGVTIKDLASVNGTMVNEHAVFVASIKDGDVIKVADTSLKFHFREDT